MVSLTGKMSVNVTVNAKPRCWCADWLEWRGMFRLVGSYRKLARLAK